jgi:hypothetical protein
MPCMENCAANGSQLGVSIRAPRKIESERRIRCPKTPTIADILQAVGSLTVYAVDAPLMDRPRAWNYRPMSPFDPSLDGGSLIPQIGKDANHATPVGSCAGRRRRTVIPSLIRRQHKPSDPPAALWPDHS